MKRKLIFEVHDNFSFPERMDIDGKMCYGCPLRVDGSDIVYCVAAARYDLDHPACPYHDGAIEAECKLINE